MAKCGIKKYKLRIQCVGYEDIVVEANNREDAKENALRQFQCDTYRKEGEFVEFLEGEKE